MSTFELESACHTSHAVPPHDVLLGAANHQLDQDLNLPGSSGTTA
jgi:hypothetical protein